VLASAVLLAPVFGPTDGAGTKSCHSPFEPTLVNAMTQVPNGLPVQHLKWAGLLVQYSVRRSDTRMKRIYETR